MIKIHTRIKRKLNITRSRRGRFRNIEGKKGAKTFSTADKAKDYALNVLKKKEDSFEIVPAKKNKRFKVL